MAVWVVLARLLKKPSKKISHMVDIFSMTHWSWLILGLVLLALELLAPFAFFLWLGVAALVTGIVLFFIPELGWQGQFLLFSILSIISIIISRRFLFKKSIDTELPNLNRREQQYIGRIFTLSESIINGYGKIAVDDSFWQVTGPELEKGAQVKVVGANGSIFQVEKV